LPEGKLTVIPGKRRAINGLSTGLGTAMVARSITAAKLASAVATMAARGHCAGSVRRISRHDAKPRTTATTVRSCACGTSQLRGSTPKR
jgi:hypothetical protein